MQITEILHYLGLKEDERRQWETRILRPEPIEIPRLAYDYDEVPDGLSTGAFLRGANAWQRMNSLAAKRAQLLGGG